MGWVVYASVTSSTYIVGEVRAFGILVRSIDESRYTNFNIMLEQ